MEQAAEDECERLREESRAATRKLLSAQEETDLKRETSRKLKEEIIDNDRLTVANLNRIKHLEALVEQHKQALDEAETENGELRQELGKSVDHEELVEKQQAQLEALQEVLHEREELLHEREAQILALSRRLSESNAFEAEVGGGGRGGRRDSFLERFHLGGPKSLLASGA